MILLDRTMVNLASSRAPNLFGHISIYETPSGNLYYSYYVEQKFYASKEICKETNKIIKEESTDNDYHYSIDIFFNDKSRHLGWVSTKKGTHFSD